MSITLHCNYCGKKIDAPDSAASKWGKCPGCHNKLYVPGPASDEELKLTPVDERDEERKKQLMAETRKLEQDILLESEEPAGQANNIDTSTPKTGERELTKSIIKYLRQMADSELEQAESILALIQPHRSTAIKILDRIALSEIPEPALADISHQVLAGLIRTLRNKLS